jgi:excisionase family DNA binding protein
MNDENFIPIRSEQSRALADHLDALHGSPRKLNAIKENVQELSDKTGQLEKSMKFKNQEWLSREEAANLLGISVDSIDRRRKDGTLKSYQLDGSSVIRFKRSDLEALMI